MSEAFVVTNHGNSRIVPTYQGNLTLSAGFSFHSKDLKLIEELNSLPFIEAKSLGDIDSMSIQKLRKLASICGIKGSFYMKKVELIEYLGGN